MIIKVALDRVEYYAASAAVSYANATVDRPQYIEVEARDTPKLIFFDREGSGNSFQTVPQTHLPSEQVLVGDGETEGGGINLTLQKDFETFKTDGPDIIDSDPVFDVDKVLDDSVNAVEAKVFVFTDFIDFDPSDADVDPDPVTMAEADTKAIDKVATDTVVATEVVVNDPDIVKTDSVAASDAVDDFDVNKTVADTATASEAVDRFDVTTEFDDTVTATEALAKDFTQVNTDDVTAVQSNVKTFASNVDFDLSDADVDPDPVTASDAIDDFDVSKGLGDSINAIEASAKEVTLADIADNDATSVADSDTKDFTLGGISDSLTAVEGIKNNPDIVKTDAVTTSEAVNLFDIRPAYSDTATPTDAVDDFDISIVRTDSVSITDVNIKSFTQDVDFDTSDADADADPVTMSENSAATLNKNISTAASGTQTFVVTVVSSGGNKFAIDGVTNPTLELVSGVTYTFDVSDSSNSGHPLRFKDGSSSYTDGVTVSGTAGQSGATVTFAVPNDAPASTLVYYCTVHGNAMGNGISVPNSSTANQVLMVESTVFEFTNVYTDTATVTESLTTTLALGDLTFLYPDFVTVSDGYIGGFIKEPYSYTISSTEYFVPNTGVIGAAETLNTVIMAADRVTVPDESSSGLIVNFHYTDVDEDDRALGGYQFNQTPLNPGNSTVGQRAIL